jgi:predicted amidophosphoribosyltransferase
MFCPACKDEFRAGFTRCASCDVDLVEQLSAADPQRTSGDAAPPLPSAVPMVEYCGFFDLDEARQAWDTLRRERIRADVLIREAPDGVADGPIREEYWLRVAVSHASAVAAILGYDRAEAEDSAEQMLACGECGRSVSTEETFCPHCGKRFEDDL